MKAQHRRVLDALVHLQPGGARRIKANHGSTFAGSRHAKRYLAGEDVFDIADRSFPPCPLMRLLLEHLLSLSHKSSACLLIVLEDPRSPGAAAAVAAVRACTGMERWLLGPARELQQWFCCRPRRGCRPASCRQGEHPFVTEQALRAEGHAKTPDIKLELPIAVKGVVNWIDSKASFCDPLVHVERGAEQFKLRQPVRAGDGGVLAGVIDEVADEASATCCWWTTSRTGRT